MEPDLGQSHVSADIEEPDLDIEESKPRFCGYWGDWDMSFWMWGHYVSVDIAGTKSHSCDDWWASRLYMWMSQIFVDLEDPGVCIWMDMDELSARGYVTCRWMLMNNVYFKHGDVRCIECILWLCTLSQDGYVWTMCMVEPCISRDEPYVCDYGWARRVWKMTAMEEPPGNKEYVYVCTRKCTKAFYTSACSCCKTNI